MHQPKLSKIENGHIEATSGEEALIRAALSTDIEILTEKLQIPCDESLRVDDEPVVVPHCHPYPAAPTDPVARRAWVSQRTRNMERGFPSPESGTFGGKKKNA